MWVDSSTKKFLGIGAHGRRLAARRNRIEWRDMDTVGVGTEEVLEKVQKACLRSALLDRISYILKRSQDSFIGKQVMSALA